MGRRAPDGVVGLQNDLLNLHERNPLLTSLRSRSHDTCGDQSTLLETRNIQPRREFRTLVM